MPTTPDSFGTSRDGIVFDATVLSCFARSGQFEGLERIYAGLGWTTLMVVEETYRGIEAGYSALEIVERTLAHAGWLAVTSPENAEEQSLCVSLLSALGADEASWLATAGMRGMVQRAIPLPPHDRT